MIPEHGKCPNAENNISKTGYRALFMLLKLLEAPRTREEFLDFFSMDPIINKDISKDTVTVTINTLRKAGCMISRPTQRTNNKYVLKSHPFNVHFSKENILALQSLRDSIVTLDDMELLLYLNNVYTKIAHLAPDIESKNLLLYNQPLRGIDYKILNELIIYARIKKHINICYNSPKNGAEDLDFIPEFLTFESKKLYVWGYCKKYDEFAYLRVDKISRVNLVTFSGKEDEKIEFQKPVVVVQYKLKGYSALMYTENHNEIVISENTDEKYNLKIQASVSNKFNFYQRLLSYGTDCIILSPDSIKEEFIQKLRDIRTEYENEVY